jgi:hypothetical protein
MNCRSSRNSLRFKFQYTWLIFTIIILANTCILQITYAAYLELTFWDLVHRSELILIGKVLDKKLVEPGSIGKGLVNYTVSVQKVITGDPVRNSISVVTEPEIYEDSPKMKIGELVILFLNHDKVYGDIPAGNDYAVVNFDQGKYEIENGLVTGTATDFDTLNMTIFDFEKKVFNAMAEPESMGSENVSNYSP